jgi:hypothetical protein
MDDRDLKYEIWEKIRQVMQYNMKAAIRRLIDDGKVANMVSMARQLNMTPQALNQVIHSDKRRVTPRLIEIFYRTYQIDLTAGLNGIVDEMVKNVNAAQRQERRARTRIPTVSQIIDKEAKRTYTSGNNI